MLTYAADDAVTFDGRGNALVVLGVSGTKKRSTSSGVFVSILPPGASRWERPRRVAGWPAYSYTIRAASNARGDTIIAAYGGVAVSVDERDNLVAIVGTSRRGSGAIPSC